MRTTPHLVALCSVSFAIGGCVLFGPLNLDRVEFDLSNLLKTRRTVISSVGGAQVCKNTLQSFTAPTILEANDMMQSFPTGL